MFQNIFTAVRVHFELISWLTFICVLYFLPVDQSQQSLCLSRLLGFGKCPGCGLGHSICYALHGRINDSFQAHIMGIPGLLVIFNRIRHLLLNQRTTYEA